MNKFGSTHYVPILRWKLAEKTALAQLYEHDSTCLTPLVELVPENFIHKDSKGRITKLSINEVINRVGGQLYRYWGERPFFIDLWLLSPDILNQGSNHFLAMLGQYARTLKLSLIPVTGIARDSTYQSAVRTVLGIYNQGACLRLSLEDIKRSTLAKDTNNLLSLLQLRPELVDLIIDFKAIEHSAPTFNTLCELIPSIDRWRNFVVASGAFPEDLRGLQKNDIHRIERIDWKSWKDQITATTSIPRIPIYSDYTIQHALYLKRKGGAHYSASIRYTAEDYWVIMRGEDVFRRDGPGFEQWPAQAILLCDLPEYCQETFSEGDKYISQMSLQRKQTGNIVTWLRAGFNHHMTFVVRQLANLLETSTVALS
jgi:hypothetical protein